MRHRPALRRLLPILVVPALITAAGCDIVTADYRSEETAQWQKTYPLAADGQVEIGNVNGKITVEPSSGTTVEVVAIKKAKGSSPEAAKAALQRISFVEDVSASRVSIETKIDRQSGGWFSGGGLQVEYHVKVPAAAQVKFTTVNGAIDLSDLKGRINAETTNGEIRGRNLAGAIDASTTNGGLDVDMSEVPAGGVKLECTNGGIRLHLPKDGTATFSAPIPTGAIKAAGLSIESREPRRRRLDGTLNGGGPRVDIDGTNGGITLSAR
jgi:hypothetical protein